MSLLLAIANVPSVKIWLTDLHKMAEKTINHTELTAQLATITLTEILTPLANSGPKTHAWRERKKKQERVWNILPGLTASGWIVIYCRYVAGETREVRSNNSIYIIGKLKLLLSLRPCTILSRAFIPLKPQVRLAGTPRFTWPTLFEQRVTVFDGMAEYTEYSKIRNILIRNLQNILKQNTV